MGKKNEEKKVTKKMLTENVKVNKRKIKNVDKDTQESFIKNSRKFCTKKQVRGFCVGGDMAILFFYPA